MREQQAAAGWGDGAAAAGDGAVGGAAWVAAVDSTRGMHSLRGGRGKAGEAAGSRQRACPRRAVGVATVLHQGMISGTKEMMQI